MVLCCRAVDHRRTASEPSAVIRPQGGRDIGPGPIPVQDAYNLYTGDYCVRVALNDLCS